ncbi:MAG: hypothetical protein HOP11_15550 [Saprospiraceae bacterium]|nr:hypothetical protein [Saprospiraceae bacterium]
MKYSIFILFVFVFSAESCHEKLNHNIENYPNLPIQHYNYESLPDERDINFFRFANFQRLTINFGKLSPDYNPVSNAGATLGRVLFYDKNLSFNNTISCGSCHSQKNSFVDNLDFSPGFQGEFALRNTPSVLNVGFQNSYFWDGREIRLEDMVLGPIQNHIEMGIDKIENLENKLASLPYYPDLFLKAFGTKEVNTERISKALAQFLRATVSFKAKIDNKENHFTLLEELGFSVFNIKAGCVECHAGVNFKGYDEVAKNTSKVSSFANIGLEMEYKDPGLGKYQVFKDGHFKVPGLRNIALTGPYMHDGRFKTLDEVIEHYNSGVKDHPYLSFGMKNVHGKVKRLNLSQLEKDALRAFLHTLTDYSILNDQRFSNPFVN